MMRPDETARSSRGNDDDEYMAEDDAEAAIKDAATALVRNGVISPCIFWEPGDSSCGLASVFHPQLLEFVALGQRSPNPIPDEDDEEAWQSRLTVLGYQFDSFLGAGTFGAVVRYASV
jgi:hypothetical protein